MKLNLKKTLLAAAVALTATGAQAATELTVYTALEADQLKSYSKAFEQANPDVKIRWVRGLYRHHHCAPAGREGQPSGRRRPGSGRDQPAGAERSGDAAARTSRPALSS